MTKFQPIKTEYATGMFMGANYGPRVRIVMRSAESVVWVGYGVHIARRNGGDSWHNKKQIAKKVSRDALSTDYAREMLVKHFGEGADDAVLLATKPGMGTVLVDGGGQPFPLPHAVQAVIHAAEYEAVSATRHHIITPDRLCMQCSKPLIPTLDSHSLAPNPLKDPNHPRTVEDCQQLTNRSVYSVLGYGSNHSPDWWPFVSSFQTWDGESYQDNYFCSDACAVIYGRRAAAELPPLAPGGAPPARGSRMGDFVSHYERPVIVTSSGLRI